MSSSPVTSPIQTTFTRGQLFKETMRILSTNRLHFLTLSLLFFPLSFSLISFLASAVFDFTVDIKSQFAGVFSLRSIPVILLYIVLVIFPALCGISSNTYSAYCAFHRKTIKISSSIKSISHSFIPLISVSIAGLIALILASGLFVVSVGSVSYAIRTLGFHDHAVTNWASLIASIMLVFSVVTMLAKWGSVAAIVVLESVPELRSKRGFEPLRRNGYFPKGMFGKSLAIIIYSGISIGMMMYSNTVVEMNLSVGENDGRSCLNIVILVFQRAAVSMYVALIMVQHTVANAALYGYCKAVNGGEVAAPAATEYVELSIDGENSSNNGGGAVATAGYAKLLMDDGGEKGVPPMTCKVAGDENGRSNNGGGGADFCSLLLWLSMFWCLCVIARITI